MKVNSKSWQNWVYRNRAFCSAWDICLVGVAAGGGVYSIMSTTDINFWQLGLMFLFYVVGTGLSSWETQKINDLQIEAVFREGMLAGKSSKTPIK